MPCDIGYKNITKVRVEPKLPQEFKEKTKAPKIDKSLLDDLGVNDAVFLEWAADLNIDPLLGEALKHTLKSVGETTGIEFLIRGGELEMKSKFMDAKEKKVIAAIAKKVAERFQIETIGIIAQLLDYVVVIQGGNASKNKGLAIEGEKEENANVHKYFKVSIDPNGEGLLVFEHFESSATLKQERAKFLTLAQKFGIKIRLSEEYDSGKPIAQNAEHRHFLKERG